MEGPTGRNLIGGGVGNVTDLICYLIASSWWATQWNARSVITLSCFLKQIFFHLEVVRALITSINVQVEYCGMVTKISPLIFSLFANH